MAEEPKAIFGAAAPPAGSDQQLTTSSALAEALQTIAGSELDYAAEQIAALPADRERAVHQCRKAIKRLRALVRMGVAVPGVQPRTIDRRLRNAGRTLAPVRDALEVTHTLGRLLNQHPWLKSLEGMPGIAVTATDIDVSTEATLAHLEEVQAALEQFFEAGGAWTFANVVAGIESTYARAAEHMHQFSRSHRDSIAHEWRKDVQRLANQLQIIKDLCPDSLQATLRALSELADVLGEHNDLSVLRARIKAGESRLSLPKKTRRAFSDVSKAQQRILRTRALALGGDIFARSPEVFRDSLSGE